MSRSIHTTKKDLKRERYFSASDGVSPSTDATELETQHFKKLLYKDNEKWKRAAQRKNVPVVGTVRLIDGELVFKRVKMRADKPEDPPSESH